MAKKLRGNLFFFFFFGKIMQKFAIRHQRKTAKPAAECLSEAVKHFQHKRPLSHDQWPFSANQTTHIPGLAVSG